MRFSWRLVCACEYPPVYAHHWPVKLALLILTVYAKVTRYSGD